jgi:hypothetical protein
VSARSRIGEAHNMGERGIYEFFASKAVATR